MKFKLNLNTAIELRENGKYQEAEEWLSNYISYLPKDIEAYSLITHIYILNNKLEKAEEVLFKLISIDPSNIYVYKNKARILLKKLNNFEALETARIAYKNSPNDLEAILILATCLAANQQLDDALFLIEQVIEKESNYAEAYANRAIIRLNKKDIEGAIEDAKKTASIKPHYDRIWELLSFLLYQAKKLPEAIDALKRGLEFNPTNINYICNLADYLRQENKIANAIEILLVGTKIDSKNEMVWSNLGACLHQIGKNNEAKQAYENVLIINPNSIEIINNLGVLARLDKDWNSALKYFDKGINLNPKNLNIIFNKSLTLLLKGEFLEAIKNIEYLLSIDENQDEAIFMLSAALAAINSTKEAKEKIDWLIEKKYNNDRKLENEKIVHILKNNAKILLNLEKYDAAQIFIEKVLVIKTNDIDSLQLKGMYYCRQSFWENAEICFRKALQFNENNIIILKQLAGVLEELKNYKEARSFLAKALILNPDNIDTIEIIGNHYLKQELWEEAENWLQKALNYMPENYSILRKLIDSLDEMKRYEDSRKYIENALKIRPNDFEILKISAINYVRQNSWENAEDIYIQLLKLRPDSPGLHNNLASIKLELGKLDEAEKNYRNELIINPSFVEAHSNLGLTLQLLNRYYEAELSYREALRVNPYIAEIHSNLGSTQNQLGRIEDAEASYKKALELNPELAQAHSNLGLLLGERGLWEESVKCHQTAVSLDPDSVEFRWALSLSQIPKVVENECDTSKFLSQFNTELTKLSEFIDLGRMDEASKFVGKVQPYYIAYFNNNNKDLLIKYGEICCNVMKFWQEKRLSLSLQPRLDNTKKIKLGIISSHIRYHSIWNAYLKGIITQIDKEYFDLYIYCLEGNHDAETNIAKNNSHKFISGPKSLDAWYDVIYNDNLDIIFFPEIGMNQKTLQLASMRIAKSQVTSWGHPETSGLPTMDYYLSASLLEDSKSANNYSEKLVCLDNIGCYFDPPSLEKEDIDLATFGINLSSNILLCLGIPNKFHPDNDWIFVEISKRITDCQLIFMQDDKLSYKVLEKRLRLKFKNNGLKSEGKIIFIPNLTRNGFNTLMSAGKILLDNMYFSSFNTSMQALGCNLPVVTMQGKFMRSRATSGILKMIKVEELIAINEKNYIEIIEKLVNDGEYYKFLKDKINNNINLLYRDTSPIRSLEKFLTNTHY